MVAARRKFSKPEQQQIGRLLPEFTGQGRADSSSGGMVVDFFDYP